MHYCNIIPLSKELKAQGAKVLKTTFRMANYCEKNCYVVNCLTLNCEV